MHNNNPTNSPDKYYLGMIDENNQILFYVWLGDCWFFVNPDPKTWGTRIYTFCRMSAKVAKESIEEVRAYKCPYREDSPFYRDFAKYRMFTIPVEDAPLWGLPAGGE